MQKVIKRNENIIWKKIEDEIVLLNPASGDYFGLNNVGVSFWISIDNKRTLKNIIDLLYAEFCVERSILEKDIDELIEEMENKNIIEVSKSIGS